MSGIFMRVDGVTGFKGVATVKKIADKDGWFPISSYDVDFSRSIYKAVGSAADAEVGVPSISDVAVQRGADNASAVLSTLFFAPGEKGKKISIIETAQGKDGKGLVPTKVIELEEARISSYHVTNGKTSMAISYSTISIIYYFEASGGKIEKADTVKFDVGTAQLVSGNSQAMA